MFEKESNLISRLITVGEVDRIAETYCLKKHPNKYQPPLVDKAARKNM
jgi:hypothetical protein